MDELNDFDIETDARLSVIEALLAGLYGLLIDKELIEARLVTALSRELQNVASSRWAGLTAEQSATAAKARHDALQRFLIQLR